MNRMKKVLATTMALGMVLGCTTACMNSPTSNDGVTVINFMNTGGGIGRVWLDEAAARFEEKYKDFSFEQGKKGVKIEIENNLQTGVETIKTAGYHMYTDQGAPTARALSASESVLDITDIITEKAETRDGKQISIEDKIQEEYLATMKGTDGKYYVLPHYAWYPGLTYDAELFEAKNLFLADPSDGTAKDYKCKYGSVKFVSNANTKKSCGNDGEFGTADDGLPTSMVELFVLCARMKQMGITPFELNGRSNHYINYVIKSLWTALSGYNTMEITYTFEGDLEVVKDYTEENLFAGINYIKKPVTEKVKVTEDTGYLATHSVYRYYASSIVEIMVREGWLSNDSGSNTTHIEAQTNFVYNGVNNRPSYGILIEGNYWYNESRDNYVFDDYFDYTNTDSRDIRWMALPTHISESVTGSENARENMLIDTASCYSFINANIKDNVPLVKACKKFLQFLYSDEELSHFTGATGTMRAAIDYELLEEDYNRLSSFQQGVIDLAYSGRTLFSCADNDRFLNARDDYSLYKASSVFGPRFDKSYAHFLAAIRAGKTAKECFEITKTLASAW